VDEQRSAQFPAGAALQSRYDDLAGSSVLTRSGKAATDKNLRGDVATTILSARRRNHSGQALAKQLRELYQSVLAEPIPDRFIELLGRLEAEGVDSPG